MSSKTALDIPPSLWKNYKPFRSDVNKGTVTSSGVNEAYRVAKCIADELSSRFGSKKILLFGSLAHGSFNKWSDIDLAVCGIPPADYYKAVAFASGFSSEWKVDLVDVEDCSEALREIILKEGIEL